MKLKSYFLLIVLTFSLASSANAFDPVVDAKSIYDWNAMCTSLIEKVSTEDPGFTPMQQSRIAAMMHLGMHNVLNTISPKYSTYHFSASGFTNASIEAAVAQVSYEILAYEFPTEIDHLKSFLKTYLLNIDDNKSKEEGIKLGHLTAVSMLTLRENDGSGSAQFNVKPGIAPGDYRFTAPFDGPPFNTPPAKGFVALPGWNKVQPFVMLSSSQFRPKEKPFALTSKKYTEDYNEVKEYGCQNCPDRSADQTELALFWMETGSLGWDRIANKLSRERNLDAHEVARLLALLHVAIADSYISSIDAKNFYNYWRPVTAVHLADTDGNDATEKDVNWKELGFPTPPISDYPSAHAHEGGAAVEVLINVFGSDNISFMTTSTTAPGAERRFTSFSEAAKENSDSRVYIGYHFRHATIIGEKQGRKVGKYVAKNLFNE